MTPAHARAAEIDVGLRQYMLRVYNYMASGLALTGVVAYALSTTPQIIVSLHTSGLIWVFFIATIGVVWYFAARIATMQPSTAQGLFWTISVLYGVVFSSIFLVYTGASIAQTFFIAASMFLAMSLFGYSTRRDLTGWGSFLFMGLIGMIIAFVVNIFFQNPMLYFLISGVGVIVFTGLTAYDTQRIKEVYYVGDGGDVATKKAISGALKLYIDFVGIFIYLLHFLGV
ncbi:MAG: Bax inhibitor-1 family protein, partial [Kiloniellales bacterium]